MACVALVTGGVSGIGAATATLLKSAGYTVVANYFGNSEEAAAFTAASGIPVREWSVADYEASRAGVAAVEQEFGPVEILITNAGITRDSTLQGIVAAVPVGRLAEPDEIARGVLFLVDDKAGFITGITLSINGGKYLA